jgi:hypothetical protein
MREMPVLLLEAPSAIREVRTTDDPAVQRLVASALLLSETVGRLTRERGWNRPAAPIPLAG